MKVYRYLVDMLLIITFLVVLFSCMFTPEKDKYGNYTNPVKYWTDDQYFASNFGGVK